MKTLMLTVLLCLAASVMFGATLPATQLRGEYIEARTADVYTGPCFANSEVELTGNLAVMGWKIDKGSFEGVPLAGLSVVGVVRASGTLGDHMLTNNPAKAVLIVDEKATPEQRLALKKFAQRMAGDLLADVVRVDAQPIEFSAADIHSRKAKLAAGTLARIETRALEAGDQICHNEGVWYAPLVALDHAMAAYALAHEYNGAALGTQWSYPNKRSAFVGTFQFQE